MHPMAVLGDPVRRALLARMSEGEQTAGALASRVGAEFGISHSAISQHLATLRNHGFATARARGRERVYRLAPEGFTAAEKWLLQYRSFWETALDDLGRELDGEGFAPERDL
jgi:DNA-binding transcriptional ArsR family regulator